ncbi:polyphosphate polymerase domain-containing protein [Marasmitruncus massiliensis]|uniref:polyphosphate polymerase domain-containing protein n=1 Tax=Marasmitruncus massiliensis TaxID=1944642 RepID=UPI000C79F4CA|nr:polyphosphate polymerase domain-containing protein [Marasmitruncus massiliensis]
MSSYQDVFKRYEKKYLLSEQQYATLHKELESRMTVDQYGRHTICNLYFDTDSFELIRASLDKPVYKEKLRLRSYGVPSQDDTVFIELKKKYKGVVYKRRVPITLREASDYLLRGTEPEKTCQILHEIGWFMKLYRPSPKAFIAYDRVALSGNENSSLRVTFDRNIRFRESLLDLSRGDWGNLILDSKTVLMEIKIPGAMPVWMSDLLTELAIFPTSFSKYGTCYKDHLIQHLVTNGGPICA